MFVRYMICIFWLRFVASREQNEAFPDYPEEDEGGSAVIFDPPPPKADADGDGDGGADPKGKTGGDKKGGDKKGGDKGKKADAAAKKGKKGDEEEEKPAELPVSPFVLKMQVRLHRAARGRPLSAKAGRPLPCAPTPPVSQEAPQRRHLKGPQSMGCRGAKNSCQVADAFFGRALLGTQEELPRPEGLTGAPRRAGRHGEVLPAVDGPRRGASPAPPVPARPCKCPLGVLLWPRYHFWNRTPRRTASGPGGPDLRLRWPRADRGQRGGRASSRPSLGYVGFRVWTNEVQRRASREKIPPLPRAQTRTLEIWRHTRPHARTSTCKLYARDAPRV